MKRTKGNREGGEILIATCIVAAWFFTTLGLGVGSTIADAKAKEKVKQAGLNPAILDLDYDETGLYKTRLRSGVEPGKILLQRYGLQQAPALELEGKKK